VLTVFYVLAETNRCDCHNVHAARGLCDNEGDESRKNRTYPSTTNLDGTGVQRAERTSRMDWTIALGSISTLWRNVLASAGRMIGGREESVCFLETG